MIPLAPIRASHSIEKSEKSSYAPSTQCETNDYNEKANDEKLLITGDDVLIEYVSRLMIAVKSIKENLLR